MNSLVSFSGRKLVSVDPSSALTIVGVLANKIL